MPATSRPAAGVGMVSTGARIASAVPSCGPSPRRGQSPKLTAQLQPTRLFVPNVLCRLLEPPRLAATQIGYLCHRLVIQPKLPGFFLPFPISSKMGGEISIPTSGDYWVSTDTHGSDQAKFRQYLSIQSTGVRDPFDEYRRLQQAVWPHKQPVNPPELRAYRSCLIKRSRSPCDCKHPRSLPDRRSPPRSECK
jgi:hypothetical protein